MDPLEGEPPPARDDEAEQLVDPTEAETGSARTAPQSKDAEPRGIDLNETLGGRRGLFDSGVPGAVFVLAYTAGGYWWPESALRWALIAALATAAGLAVLRLVRRESLRQTLFGLFGVGLGAFLAARSGNAADFYLPGLLIQAGYGLVYLTSALVGWPIVGVVLGPLLGEGMSWRGDPTRRRMYAQVTWLWVATFGVRLLVQLPLYLAGATIALGVARLVMGWPLFLLAMWMSYVLVRRAPPPRLHLAGAEEGGP